MTQDTYGRATGTIRQQDHVDTPASIEALQPCNSVRQFIMVPSGIYMFVTACRNDPLTAVFFFYMKRWCALEGTTAGSKQVSDCINKLTLNQLMS